MPDEARLTHGRGILAGASLPGGDGTSLFSSKEPSCKFGVPQVKGGQFSLLHLRLGMEIGRPYSRLLQRLDRLGSLSAHDRQLIAELPLTVANFSANEVVVRDGDALS